jgi:predicted HTH transcriptional regulator
MKTYCKKYKKENIQCKMCPIYRKYQICKYFVEIDESPNLDMIMSPLQKQIMKELTENGSMDRNELVQRLNKPRTTVYDNIVGLINNHYIVKRAEPLNARGRPLVKFWRVV